MNPQLASMVLLAHTLCTIAMTGLVWFVQVVHYPLMAHVPAERFAAFEARHVSRTGLVVAPLMLGEALAAGILLVWPPADAPMWMLWAGAGVLALIWLSTFGVQVPLHNKLSKGWDPAAHALLVRSNLPRTLLWTARAVLAGVLAIGPGRFGLGGAA